jgi:monothiol glutaredoxin
MPCLGPVVKLGVDRIRLAAPAVPSAAFRTRGFTAVHVATAIVARPAFRIRLSFLLGPHSVSSQTVRARAKLWVYTRAMRPLLDSAKVRPAALDAITAFHEETVREVQKAVSEHDVVVVGMAQNPWVRRARKALEAAGVKYTYLEYGSYLSEWKKRLAIKLWSGWPTFPQVFVKGSLIGGYDATAASIADGSLKG